LNGHQKNNPSKRNEAMSLNVKEKRLQELRQQAESLLAEKIKDTGQVKLEDVKEVVNELQVHRIELEMQNEELRRIQSELQESQDKYLNLYNSAPIGYFTLDTNGVILEVNATGAGLFGIEKQKLLKNKFTHLISPESQDDFYFHCRELYKTAIRRHCEITFMKADGSLFYGQIESSIIHDNIGNINQHHVVVIDITERKQAEKKAREIENLKELDRLRTELLANISHELRTPLTSIKGYSTLLIEYNTRLESEEKLQYLKTIDMATDRLTELIDQLLDMSRLDSGIIEIEKRPADVNKLLRDVINEAQIRSSDHILILDIPGNIPRLSIDSRRIREVLENLISNSVKYSKDNTEIKVVAQCDTHELLISVADQGIGIPQNELPRVFDRFYRSRRRQVKSITGVGLGLSICKKLVEAHGGRIWIESKEGKGTTCFFSLPIISTPGDGYAAKS
jgi:PAS domain S-box-containing protein